jgi:hypothetical protein
MAGGAHLAGLVRYSIQPLIHSFDVEFRLLVFQSEVAFLNKFVLAFLLLG